MPTRYSPYRPEEDAVIREHYNRRGVDFCMKLLPGRTRGSIVTRAYRLGACHSFKPRGEHIAALARKYADASLQGYTKTQLIQAIIYLRKELEYAQQ